MKKFKYFYYNWTCLIQLHAEYHDQEVWMDVTMVIVCFITIFWLYVHPGSVATKLDSTFFNIYLDHDSQTKPGGELSQSPVKGFVTTGCITISG